MEIYAAPISTSDTCVLLARIKAATDSEFKNVEARLIYFIEKVLNLADDDKYKENDALRVRFSRLWLLRDKSIRYTWDFTFKGDLSLASELMRSVSVLPIKITRTEEVSTQLTETPRGSVKPVRIGSM
jgi:hypothetical protein